MEVLLAKATQHAMNYALRSGIAVTSKFAIGQCSKLLKTVKGTEKAEIAALQMRLQSKIRIISPAIDMIELIAARGNTSLETAVTLTKELRWDIQALGVRLAKAVTDEELSRKGSSKAKSQVQSEVELRAIISDMKTLLSRIEDAVPLINLAITTSGVNLSTSMPTTVSPSRAFQASMFLTHGDGHYSVTPGRAVQIGPVFHLSMYMLFTGHAYRPHDEEGVRETTWKEAIHKARVKLLRVPLDQLSSLPSPESASLSTSINGGTPNGEFDTHLRAEARPYEFAYQLLIIEDLDDDRVHTFEEDEPQPEPYEDVQTAGIREVIPIHQISKIFYADTGKILNIGTDEVNNPILLLKRDVNAVPPRRMMEQDEDEGDEEGDLESPLDTDQATTKPAASNDIPHRPWRIPPNLDPEWIALEVYTEDPESDSEDDLDTSEIAEDTPPKRPIISPSLSSAFSRLRLRPSNVADPSSSPATPPHKKDLNENIHPSQPSSPWAGDLSVPAPAFSIPALRTSLSLLETLIRLTALQQFQQSSHLACTDELLNFFLSEASTTGAGADSDMRRRVRRDARAKVGFDPYDESPIKRRGEDYLQHAYDHHDDDDASSRPGWDDGEAPLPGSPASSRMSRGGSPAAYGGAAPSSPSPLLRRGTRERSVRSGTPERQQSVPVGFGGGLDTPPGTTKSREQMLRPRDEGSMRRKSPLGMEVSSPEAETTEEASTV